MQNLENRATNGMVLVVVNENSDIAGAGRNDDIENWQKKKNSTIVDASCSSLEDC